MLPVMALVAAGMVLMRAITGKNMVVVDPVIKADERAKAEESLRDAAAVEEQNRLELELVQAQKDQDEKRTEFEAEEAKQVQELREDPNKLRDAMIEAGRPR